MDQRDLSEEGFPEDITEALGNRKLLKHRDSDVKCARKPRSTSVGEICEPRAARTPPATPTPRAACPVSLPRLGRALSRLLVATCQSDLLRIYAPETPYPDDQLKVKRHRPRCGHGSAATSAAALVAAGRGRQSPPCWAQPAASAASRRAQPLAPVAGPDRRRSEMPSHTRAARIGARAPRRMSLSSSSRSSMGSKT